MPRRLQVRVLLPQVEANMAEDLEQNIRENAQGPKRAQADSVSVEQHDLKDQIEADRYLSSKEAAKKGLGVRMTKVVPPGAV